MPRRPSNWPSTASILADVTRLLADWSRGDRRALDVLVPVVQSELRRIARRHLERERDNHTLQPTALVNELYLRLVEQTRASWTDRVHFFAVASQLMRRILVDHARFEGASKRGGSVSKVSLTTSVDVASDAAPALDVLAIDRALTRLAALDPEQARVVELRVFGGLSVAEAAHVLGRSERTIKREWRLAKAWLRLQLA
jgi:RNA polymerase sigma factor (TIGR02999 family)